MLRPDLEEYTTVLESSVGLLNAALHRAYERYGVTEEERLAIKDELVILKRKYFGESSERRPGSKESDSTVLEDRAPKVLLPSLRYPDLSVVEEMLDFNPVSAPACGVCGVGMKKMNPAETSEYITVQQKEFYIVRQHRAKYRCPGCYSCIRTVPAPSRMKPGSSFSDEVAVDIAVAKYAEHMPIERYAVQAERLGLKGILPQTLLEQTHYLADTMKPLYERIKKEVLHSPILQADETPWKMLEGDEKKNWFMWGFFNNTSSYYEAKNSRATEAAREFIKDSKAEYLMSDAYSGYSRVTQGTKIKNAFCMAHARRKFVEAEPNYPEALPFVDLIGELYQLEREMKDRSPPEKKQIRQEKSRPILDKIQTQLFALQVLPQSSIGKARNYLLKHWTELTRFLEDGRLPIDNNLSERGLRGIVLGRKNYYGNHSRRGAHTTAVLYSVIETCKLNRLDPYRYLLETVQAILNDQPFFTPAQYVAKYSTG